VRTPNVPAAWGAASPPRWVTVVSLGDMQSQHIVSTVAPRCAAGSTVACSRLLPPDQQVGRRVPSAACFRSNSASKIGSNRSGAADGGGNSPCAGCPNASRVKVCAPARFLSGSGYAQIEIASASSPQIFSSSPAVTGCELGNGKTRRDGTPAQIILHPAGFG